MDDTIHFLFKFKTVFDRTGDRVYAVQKTIRTTGHPIVATSLILTVGFAVLCFASIKSIALFGVLVPFYLTVWAQVHLPSAAMCTDNGAMIAYAGWQRLCAGQRDSLAFEIRPRWPMPEPPE